LLTVIKFRKKLLSTVISIRINIFKFLKRKIEKKIADNEFGDETTKRGRKEQKMTFYNIR
jgi:hypothetical protein